MAKKQIEQTEIEAPYELPEGWKWCRLGDVAEYINGRAFKPEEWESEGKPIIRIQNLTNSSDTTNYSTQDFELKYLVKSGDLLFAWSASLGAYIWNREDGWLNQHIFKVVPYSNIDKMYLYNALIQVTEHLYSKTHGSGMVHVTLKPFLNTMIPLPPTLEEQQRIVNRIETLFAKLDQAKEKAQNVVDTFETRRASILHKAFTGELTAKWRKENGVGDDSWEEKTGEDIFSYITSGSRGWANYYSDSGELFIRMGNLNHGTIDLDLSEIQYVNLPNSIEGTRSQLAENDILISITADLGMIGLVKKINHTAYINQHIALARPIPENNAEFLAWELVSDVGFSQLQGNKKGSTKIGLGLSDIRNLKLQIPSLSEQAEIVSIVNIILEKESKAKEAAIAVLEQIDLLKKSILARAFRGEL